MVTLIERLQAVDPKWRSNPLLEWRVVQVELWGAIRPDGVHGAYMRFPHSGLEYPLMPLYRNSATAVNAAENCLRAKFNYIQPKII